MDKIYVIVEGEYSDWNILGYASDEYEAKKICAKHNTISSYPRTYYICAEKLCVLFEKDEIPYNKYTVVFLENKYSHSNRQSFSYCGIHDNGLFFKCENSVEEVTNFENKKFYYVYVYYNSNDMNKLKKIAEDFLYKYLAEKEGI